MSLMPRSSAPLRRGPPRPRGGWGGGPPRRGGGEPMNLFWFAHHAVLMVTVSRLPAIPCLSYGEGAGPERQLCEFILRGIGLNEAAITKYLDRDLAGNSGQPAIAESA